MARCTSPATVVDESLDAIMEKDLQGEVFVENCIWRTRPLRSLLSVNTGPRNCYIAQGLVSCGPPERFHSLPRKIRNRLSERPPRLHKEWEQLWDRLAQDQISSSSPTSRIHLRVHSTDLSSRSQIQLARKTMPLIRPCRSHSRPFSHWRAMVVVAMGSLAP